jgi:hypothetical protein
METYNSEGRGERLKIHYFLFFLLSIAALAALAGEYRRVLASEKRENERMVRYEEENKFIQ